MTHKKDKQYNLIIDHYERCLEKYGDTHLGVDWPKKEDAEKRYQIMLDVALMLKIKKSSYSLLDFGCGTAHLLEFLQREKLNQFQYSGTDISPKFIEVCTQKFPNVPFFTLDVLENPERLSQYDIIVMNGVFTEKRELTFDQMWNYFKELISLIFSKSDGAVAFNVMSKHVAWERDDLFHVPHDLLAAFLCDKVTRNYVIRNDYGLYEYTVYLYK